MDQSQRHSSIENQYAQVDDRSKLSKQNSKGSCSNLAIASSVHATTEECPSPHYEETSTNVESEVYYSTVMWPLMWEILDILIGTKKLLNKKEA